MHAAEVGRVEGPTNAFKGVWEHFPGTFLWALGELMSVLHFRNFQEVPHLPLIQPSGMCRYFCLKHGLGSITQIPTLMSAAQAPGKSFSMSPSLRLETKLC